MVLCAKKHQVTCCTCQSTKIHHNLMLQRLQENFGEFIYLFYVLFLKMQQCANRMLFYPTVLKGCQGIVFTYSGEMGRLSGLYARMGVGS